MQPQFERTENLIGSEAMEILSKSTVAVFGIGGVGGYVCEALVRSGVGHFVLVDKDVVDVSNINRQIIATMDTLGRDKVEVMKERMLSINPEADIRIHRCFFLPETSGEFDFPSYDYVVDAVDTVTAKIELVMKAGEHRVPIISSMGAGNKMDASAFRVSDIYDTKVCPLAKVMRKELKARGVESLKVVYSEEAPMTPRNGEARTPASVAFVPSVAGLVLAGEVVKDLIEGIAR